MSIQFSTAVWSAKIGDPVAKMVLLKLADNANDSGKCWPTVARIADETELSERTVQGKISTLESLGLIERSRGVNRCDYTLKLDSITCLNTPKIPRRRCTPQEMHPARDAPYPAAPAPPTPQEMHPTPQEMQLHNREPSLNRQDEPSKNRKDKCSIDELKAHAVSLGFQENDGEFVFHKLDTNGWRTKTGPVKSWRGVFNTYKSGGWLPSQKNNHEPQKPKFPGIAETIEIPIL